ncbi:TetR/AcrR family transcriptional regulator [Pseudofulvibacter geojedonensis]|uniref:TetR/AcrR family transcriptional regulator n=1 Tax=Pseudofulvibacter geojedonensis TaxID=1123758 RepID=A0ABW3HY03_9FLAO
MSKNPIGRPTNDKLILSKDEILKEALKIIDNQGEKELSFRKLAKVFGVTAMALKNHVGTRHDIIKNLVEIVYKDVSVISETVNSKEAIKQLLVNYCERVFKHPNVTRLLLADHSLFNQELFDLINSIRAHSITLLNDEKEGGVFADIISDYTNGFALAAASQNKKTDLGVLTIKDFYKGLNWLLQRV